MKEKFYTAAEEALVRHITNQATTQEANEDQHYKKDSPNAFKCKGRKEKKAFVLNLLLYHTHLLQNLTLQYHY